MYYKRGCNLNDSESCAMLGWLYKDGKYIKRNVKESLKYFDKACHLKDNVTCSFLGETYEIGEKGFLSKNLKKAREYYQKACEFGDKDSCKKAKKISLDNPCYGMELLECLRKGSDYYYGKGVEKNFDLSKRIFTYGCEQNEKHACFSLGLMYLEGKGVLMDHKTSLKFFKKSCKLGFGDACSNVAWIYMHGKKVKHNKRKAVLYEGKGCFDLKSAISCYTLGNYYSSGRGVRKNRKKAIELYKKSCELGYKDACKIINKSIRKNSFTENYLLNVIKNGKGAMPPGMAQGKDAKAVAKYIANGMKGKQPPAYVVCAGCHGANGRGVNGVAPSLIK